jgi:hypothetical protein
MLFCCLSSWLSHVILYALSNSAEKPIFFTGSDPSILFALTSRELTPKEHKINKKLVKFKITNGTVGQLYN